MTLLARTNSVEKENWATATHRSTRPADHTDILWYGGTSMIETRPKLLKTLGRLRSIRVSPVARVAAYGLLSGFRLGIFPSPNSVNSPELFTYRRARWSCIAAAPTAHLADFCPRDKYEDSLLKIQPSSVVTVGGTAVT